MKRRKRLIALKLAATLLAIADTTGTDAQAENVNLTVGQKYHWSMPSGGTAHLRGSHAVQVADQGKALEITAKQAGSADLTVGNKTLKIFVTGASGKNLLVALKNCIKNFLGLSVQMVGGQVVVGGELHRLSDWRDLAEAAKPLRSGYVFAARIDDDIKAEVLSYFNHLVAGESLPPPDFLFLPEARALIPDEYKNFSSTWDEIFAPYGIARTYQKAELTIKPLVRVNIVVAEVNKSEGQDLGVEWPDSADAQISSKFLGPSQVMLTLHALEKAGLGNILASPNLLARSGAEAEFLAGGELPIQVANRWVHDVVWKRHGIYLKIKPTADFHGRMSIELTTEVSLPDKVYGDIPSLKTDRMSTHFDLAESRTIVLSGLIRNNWDENTSGLPFLSRIPVLGRLFSSKSYNAQRSELVVFVTPEIVKTQESEPLKMPKGWQPHEF